MSPDQVHAVRGSWHKVAANPDALATAFYARLFEIDKGAARLFAGVDMAAQRQKLFEMLGLIIHSLDDTDRLLPVIAALGKRHAHYGVQSPRFDRVGEALLAALARLLGDDFTPEIRTAWADAYMLVASVMRRALVRASAPSWNLGA